MKKRAEDIAPMLAEMTEHLRSLRETVSSQHSEICSLNRNTFRSDEGADAFLEILSIVETAKNTTGQFMMPSAHYSKRGQAQHANR